MENIPIKLNQLVEEFHYFEDNQVLTATQLNTVIDYLDRRDRMTRVKLFGTGVVCGLEVTHQSANNSISVSKGAAITSDGDLVHIDELTNYSFFGTYDDSKASYSFFKGTETDSSIPLFRLFNEQPQNGQNVANLSTFNQGDRSLGDMAVVLYLNSYLEPPEECTEVDCENLGTKQKNEIIPLLINKSDLDRINNKVESPFFELPETFIQRVDFHNRVITHEENLLARYKTAVENSSKALIQALISACGNAQGDFIQNIIQGIYPNSTAVAAKWKASLDTQFSNISIDDRVDVLYVYNFMKDLSQAYNEFRESIFDLLVDCCPSPALHPKHAMLGEMEAGNPFLPKTYRHHFCESPVLNHKDKRVKKAQLLHQRLDTMIQSFGIPNNRNAAIKITPSKYGDYTLGEKSIPYYYRTNLGLLNISWNYDKTIRNQSRSILGYRAADYKGTNQALEPLNYGIDQYNFYRIEGHLGKPVNLVEKELESLKKIHNLNFNIVTVQIQDELATIRPPRIRFPAIDILLHDYRSRLKADLSLVGRFNKSLTDDRLVVDSDDESGDYNTMVSQLRSSKDEIAHVTTEIASINGHLGANINAFEANYAPFQASFNRVVNRTHAINKNVYQFTQTKFETPLQKFVLDNQFNKFDGLMKYFKKKKEKVKQQYIFDKFYNQNPGMKHLSGVHEGGTFVLVYTSDANENNQRVVADFCITGCCVVELEPEVSIDEIETTPIPTFPTFPIPPLTDITFIDKISVFKYPSVKNAVNLRVGSLGSQINTVKDGLKDVLIKNTNLDTRFNPDDFNIKNYDYGVIFDAGSKGLSSRDSSLIFKDSTMGSLARSMTETSLQIRTLSNKKDKTPEDTANIKLLTNVFDDTASKLISMVGNKDKDVAFAGDDANVLELINREKASMPDNVELTKTKKKVKTLIEGTGNKPEMKKILGRF